MRSGISSFLVACSLWTWNTFRISIVLFHYISRLWQEEWWDMGMCRSTCQVLWTKTNAYKKHTWMLLLLWYIRAWNFMLRSCLLFWWMCQLVFHLQECLTFLQQCDSGARHWSICGLLSKQTMMTHKDHVIMAFYLPDNIHTVLTLPADSSCLLFRWPFIFVLVSYVKWKV